MPRNEPDKSVKRADGRTDGRSDERSDAREQALVALYEAEQRGDAMDSVLVSGDRPFDEMARNLVVGAARNAARIDELISGHARGWTLKRMPAIDRAVLRIGTYELLERPDVPIAVIIDEAVELAKRFSTDDSGRFVNGVLAAVARTVRPSSEA